MAGPCGLRPGGEGGGLGQGGGGRGRESWAGERDGPLRLFSFSFLISGHFL